MRGKERCTPAPSQQTSVDLKLPPHNPTTHPKHALLNRNIQISAQRLGHPSVTSDLTPDQTTRNEHGLPHTVQTATCRSPAPQHHTRYDPRYRSRSGKTWIRSATSSCMGNNTHTHTLRWWWWWWWSHRGSEHVVWHHRDSTPAITCVRALRVLCVIFFNNGVRL